jgi:hypothetical protein
VKPLDIDLYVGAHLVGPGILTFSAINVGVKLNFILHFNCTLSPLSVECKINQDCPDDKVCNSEECVDPCLTTTCGQNADCQASFHSSKCICRPGLQGNPYVKCIEVECRKDSDCGDKERCDKSKQECVPLCTGNPCAQGARCDARNHRETCTCNRPLQGDGYAYCTSRKQFN